MALPHKQINWHEAAEHLNNSIILCSMLGPVGSQQMQNIVMPLLTRYNAGDLTPSLYRKIMGMRIPREEAGLLFQ